jgi:glycosyltransferase domain-containing protein
MNYTIMIPTNMRPRYLKRLLDYYDSFKRQFHILIADSSHQDIKKKNYEIISSFSNLDIVYLDKYDSKINPHHKIADMISYVNDTYCVLCADDDFVVPKGIDEAVSFLEDNNDFSCAHGRYLGYKCNPEKKKFYWQPIYPYTSITSPDAEERFQCHLEHYYQTLYAVHKVDFFKMIYKELLTSDVDPILFGELLPDMLSLIYGKMKRVETFYAARAIDSRVAYWPTISEYIQRNQYENEYIKFKNCLTKHLRKNSEISEEKIMEIIDESMQKYLKSADRTESSLKLGTIIKRLHLPIALESKIKNLYGKYTNPNSYEPWTTNDPPKEYLDDFIKIRNSILS